MSMPSQSARQGILRLGKAQLFVLLECHGHTSGCQKHPSTQLFSIPGPLLSIFPINRDCAWEGVGVFGALVELPDMAQRGELQGSGRGNGAGPSSC